MIGQVSALGNPAGMCGRSARRYSRFVTHPSTADTERLVPRRIMLRRLAGRLHLWLALALGAYIVVLSVSGSAVVFRRELNQWLVPRTVESTEGERLTGEELRAAVADIYPAATIIEIREPARTERPVLVMLETAGARTDRLFDPFARRDLGESFPPT